MQGLATNVNQTVPSNRQSTIDVPVRILVPSESVGAIIGKGGQTIRQLTQQTRAKYLKRKEIFLIFSNLKNFNFKS